MLIMALIEICENEQGIKVQNYYNSLEPFTNVHKYGKDLTNLSAFLFLLWFVDR